MNQKREGIEDVYTTFENNGMIIGPDGYSIGAIGISNKEAIEDLKTALNLGHELRMRREIAMESQTVDPTAPISSKAPTVSKPVANEANGDFVVNQVFPSEPVTNEANFGDLAINQVFLWKKGYYPYSINLRDIVTDIMCTKKSDNTFQFQKPNGHELCVEQSNPNVKNKVILQNPRNWGFWKDGQVYMVSDRYLLIALSDGYCLVMEPKKKGVDVLAESMVTKVADFSNTRTGRRGDIGKVEYVGFIESKRFQEIEKGGVFITSVHKLKIKTNHRTCKSYVGNTRCHIGGRGMNKVLPIDHDQVMEFAKVPERSEGTKWREGVKHWQPKTPHPATVVVTAMQKPRSESSPCIPIEKLPVDYFYKLSPNDAVCYQKKNHWRSIAFHVTAKGTIERVETDFTFDNTVSVYPCNPPVVLQNLKAAGIITDDFDWSKLPITKPIGRKEIQESFAAASAMSFVSAAMEETSDDKLLPYSSLGIGEMFFWREYRTGDIPKVKISSSQYKTEDGTLHDVNLVSRSVVRIKTHYNIGDKVELVNLTHALLAINHSTAARQWVPGPNQEQNLRGLAGRDAWEGFEPKIGIEGKVVGYLKDVCGNRTIPIIQAQFERWGKGIMDKAIEYKTCYVPVKPEGLKPLEKKEDETRQAIFFRDMSIGDWFFVGDVVKQTFVFRKVSDEIANQHFLDKDGNPGEKYTPFPETSVLPHSAVTKYIPPMMKDATVFSNLPAGAYFIRVTKQYPSDRSMVYRKGTIGVVRNVISNAFVDDVRFNELVKQVHHLRAKEVMPGTIFYRDEHADTRMYHRLDNGQVLAYGAAPDAEKLSMHSDEIVRLCPNECEEVYPRDNVL